MPDLPDVTLVAIDTANHALALRALARSRERIRFARCVFVTDAVPPGVAVPEGIETAAIPPLASREAYSRFVLKDLVRHVESTHALLVQWDGYVVNPDAWQAAFLDCDYIGAPWFWQREGLRVGNGGFSLRSRRLLQALQDPRIEPGEAEDLTICVAFRALLERDHGIRFADEALADRFAFEAAYPIGAPFGFHGLFNFSRVVPQDELAALPALFSDTIARSPQLAQLLRNCIASGQWKAAIAIARRRLAAMPDDAEAAALQRQAETNVAQMPAAGRNDPCPCGSGKRYKHCHGAVGAPAPPPSAAPPTPDILAQRGLAAHQRGDLDAAERQYQAALEADAGHPLALHYLGVLAYQRGRAADALPMLERAVTLRPEEPEFHNNLGLALMQVDRVEDAVGAYRRALARNPSHATALSNLGLALLACNALPEAIDALRKAVTLRPDYGEAHWNLALALLANGEFAQGWREYEWRLALRKLGGAVPLPPAPRWTGEPLAGKRLLVTTEQGLGDALQFIRYARVLAERGAHVVVQSPEPLRRLLATAPGVAGVIGRDQGPPECDAHVPLLSVPGIVGTPASDVPAAVPYLTADGERRRAVATDLARIAGEAPRIGVAWAGARDNTSDRHRSCPLALLAPLLALPGIRWFSLQKNAEDDVAALPTASPLTLLDARNDFDGTAALVAELDLVVTVDTSIAHLAGALARPTWILLPFAPDWRWRLARSDSPWYPTARLFRQPRRGDWAAAIAELRTALVARFAR
jgi:tetratricopeptide (TPR) repeat protein